MDPDALMEIEVDGRVLRADLRLVTESAEGATLLLKANGGSGLNQLNPDYNQALEELLARSLTAGFALSSVRVVSRTAKSFPDEDPEVEIGGYPVGPHDSRRADLHRLIQSAVAQKFRKVGSGGSGNRQKKIELDFATFESQVSIADAVSLIAEGTDQRHLADYEADEEIVVVLKDGVPLLDPAAREEGLRRHAAAQNLLRSRALEAGFVQVRCGSNVDVAWAANAEPGTRTWIAEVKGITEANERGQLRLGLGQIIDFVDEETSHGRQVAGILFVSQQPAYLRWRQKCALAGIELAWPGNWPACLGE